jgi:hypothetical protein
MIGDVTFNTVNSLTKHSLLALTRGAGYLHNYKAFDWLVSQIVADLTSIVIPGLSPP